MSRVADGTIIELVFDANARRTALVVSRFDGLWNVEREARIGDDVLVPYSTRNNLIAHRCVLFASRPEPSGSNEELLRDIEDYLHRYVDLSADFQRIAAHYVLLSWVYDAFNEVPYLRLRGDYGTGKTRALTAIGSICYKPFFAAGASTVSPIFHTLDRFGGTLVLDEADFRFTDATSDLVKIFNNGTAKGMPVLRTIRNQNQEFNPAAFSVFGPKIVAMRGAFQDEALESRFITEETGGRPLRSDIPLNLPDTLEAEALALRNRLLHFRLCSLFRTKTNPDIARDGLEPRLGQIALPLLSMVDDPQTRAGICERLKGESERLRAGRRESLEARVLEATLRVLKMPGGASVQAIAEQLNRDPRIVSEGAISARRVGSILKRSLHIPARKSHGSYVIAPESRPRLLQLAHRYGLAQSTAP